jgi:hypothetical protein
MPMFHFNSVTGDLFLPDPEGEGFRTSTRHARSQSSRPGRR